MPRIYSHHARSARHLAGPILTLLLVGVSVPALAAGDAPAAGTTPQKDAPPKKKKKKEPPKVEVAPPPVDPEYGPQLPPETYGPQLPQPTLSQDNVLKASAPHYRFSRGHFIAAVRVGGLFAQPFGGLGASFLVGAELGWALPKLPGIGETLAITVDFAYSQPGASSSGDITDPRIDGGSYRWQLTEREFMLGVNVFYRFTWVKNDKLKLEPGRLVPYIGIGPRIFFLQSATGGTVKTGSSLPTATEQSTGVGLGVPFGAELRLGPGRIFLEAMVMWASFQHYATGPTNAGALTLEAGYRFLF